MERKGIPQLNDQHSSDWVMTRAVLTSSRSIEEQNIVEDITDFEVYEHIDKPYITGKLVMQDNRRFYERFDFQGGEIFEVEIQRTGSEQIQPIRKKFIVDEVLNTVRHNESTQVLNLHLIEYIGFTDTLLNVNKSYTGQPYEIIKKIANEYLDRNVVDNSEDNVDNSMKVLVPNMSPIESMAWIKNRATTSNGYPFFLFSTFATDNYYFLDLGTLLQATAINEKIPYTFSRSMSSTSQANRLTQIHEYKYDNIENLSTLINGGWVGANHNFYDITTATNKKIKFDIHTDLLNKVTQLNQRQNLPVISPNLKHNDVAVSNYESRNITNIFSSKIYEGSKSITEEDQIGSHKRKIVSNAMKYMMTKAPMQITVDGREFLSGKANYSIGNIVKVEFFPTREPSGDPVIDRKLSGDYLIYSARHVFTAEKCFSKLGITKIANYSSDTQANTI